MLQYDGIGTMSEPSGTDVMPPARFLLALWARRRECSLWHGRAGCTIEASGGRARSAATGIIQATRTSAMIQIG